MSKKTEKQPPRPIDTAPITDAPEVDLVEALAQARDALGDPAKLTDDDVRGLHAATEDAFTIARTAMRSYALRAYALGLALHAGKEGRDHGEYTPWVRSLGISERSASRAKSIYESLERLSRQIGQNWPISLLDLPVDELERALKPTRGETAKPSREVRSKGALDKTSDTSGSPTKAPSAKPQQAKATNPEPEPADAPAVADAETPEEPPATASPQPAEPESETENLAALVDCPSWLIGLETLITALDFELPEAVDLAGLGARDQERYARALIGLAKKLEEMTVHAARLRLALRRDAKLVRTRRMAAG